MRKRLYQDEFEQFLQDEVKQHRMYPSDHIWKNIRTQIHGYRAWPALTFISLFIISALTVSTLLNNHPDHPMLPSSDIVLAKQPISANNKVNTTSPEVTVEKNVQYFQQIAPDQITAETFADFRQDIAAANYQDEIITTPNASHDITTTPVHPAAYNDRVIYLQPAASRQVSQTAPVASSIDTKMSLLGETSAAALSITVTPEDNTTANPQLQALSASRNTADHASADAFFKDFNFVSNVAPRNKNSKFGFQFYVTPSSSYRRLSDQKVKEIIQPAVAATQTVPLSLNSGANINDVVRQRPAMGFEVGFGLLYNMTSKLKFKTGLQLNMREYYIETFQSLTDDLASLSLINYRGIETISFYSPYNNNTGYKKAQLDNRVYQLSLPLGLQWEALQGKHLGINVEASVQPTLTLNTNTYLLSTDYKHYTSGNDLIRKWNINTSMGFNISYKSGATLFMVGPQVRYQHLPTYSNLYPVKEYLLDYGIRFGITRQIR